MTDVATRVLRILSGLTQGAEFTVDSSLRDGGLESLAVTRLWFELRREFDIDIPVPWLGRCRTAGDLVARVAADLSGPAAARVDTAIPAADNPSRAAGTDEAARYAPFPLSDLQQAYLLAKDPELSDDPVGCHVYREFRFDDLDVARLTAAWHRVVDRHDVLRMVLTNDGRQRIVEDAHIPVIPVHHAPEGDVTPVRERLSHRRYDPHSFPLYAIEVTCGPAPSAVVHLSIDALLVDGHGLAVILDDWWRFYLDPDADQLAPTLTVRDCLTMLAAHQRSRAYQEDLAYWARRLADLPAGPELAPARGGLAGRRVALTGSLSRRQWQAVRDLAAGWEVSPSALVLTLFTEALHWQRDRGRCTLVLTANDRSRLPREAEAIAGPFTSSIVLPVEDTLAWPLREAVQRVHQQLWEDLGHAAVSGVAALRQVRARDRATQPVLPVVFTSLLGTGPGGGRAAATGFAEAASYAISQTTGVALDHQMWEQGGELRFRWDAIEEAFPPGGPEVLFARFANSLEQLSVTSPTVRTMNELQQAYHVARAINGPTECDGCQVCHSFAVDDLDLGRLESAWLRLVAAYDVLRTIVDNDGRLLVDANTPERWHIPVIDLADRTDPGADLAAMRDALVSHAFPLGRRPQSDLRVTVDAAGAATVHCTLDLTVADGRSIHFLYRELFRYYADPRAVARPPAREERSAAGQATATKQARAHWRARVGSLPPGPRLPGTSAPPPAGGDPARVRREGQVTGWRAARARIEAAHLSPDDLLAAALTEVFARRFPRPFSLPLVRWTAATAPLRPGEHTALSWVTRESSDTPLLEQAAAFHRVIDEDEAADAVRGLGELRKRVMRERQAGSFDLPIVYTGLLDLRDQPLPPGVRAGPWLTCTPDVSLDCIAIDEGDELKFYWDSVDSHFAPGQLNEAFTEYGDLLRGLTGVDWRQTVLYEWNRTDRAFPDQGPIHLLFEEQARLRPDAVALRWAHGTMAYAELNRWANCVAATLRRLGVGPEVGVGISVPRGPAMVAAVYGVLKAGGFYVPLEPSLPDERATTILTDAAITMVLTTRDRRGWAMPAEVSGVSIDPAEPDGAADPGDPPVTATAASTAYVIFTSGSTGKPKGVAVAHRPVRNLLAWCQRTHGFGPHDVGLCVTSLGFDLSVFDILGLLSYGASLYIADETEQMDPELLLDLLLREPITFWNSAPTTLNQLSPRFPSRYGAAGAGTLRLVYLSGDYTPLPLPDEVRALFTGARVVSLGGATEATVWSNWFDIGSIDPNWRSIPYGRPIDNARYFILDQNLHPCPAGVEGDLFIGGDCLAIGYYRQPELTAERFIPDPFSEREGARLYRTGDRALYFPDGTICFQGRADDQVKIRGFRVEPGEIEHRLRTHPGVRDVVALARTDDDGDRKLVAYVMAADGGAPTAAELRRHVKAALPDYMVPTVVVFVDEFPATSNGKLDRAALPWPTQAGNDRVSASCRAEDRAGDRVVAAPSTGEIAAIFAELLGVPEIEVDEDLWDQGVTSFTMVQASAALQERHGLRVPVSALLADPTIAGIARALAADDPGAGAPATAAPASVEFFDAADRDAFKRARWDLRAPGADDRVLALDETAPAVEHMRLRASQREFDDRPLTFEQVSRLLSLLRDVNVDGRRRRLYPSAGDTYAVQVYLHAKAGAVKGMPPGLYYYHPGDHALHLICPAVELDRSIHFVYNRPVFDRAPVGLYLFGQLAAIEPLYGPDSERFMLLEAGYIGQLLMLGQAACGMGLCPVGAVSVDPLRERLRLGDGHRFLHAFLAGPVSRPVAVSAGDADPLFTAPLTDDRRQVTSVHSELVGDIAVIGATGRFPDAENLDEFWRNLSRGASALRPWPAGRAGQPSPDDAARIGGFLSTVDTFDSLLFQLSPTEAMDLDPQLRLLLHTVWECLEDAGHTGASLNRGAGRVGVFLGAMWQDHQHIGVEHWRRGRPATVSATASDAANRISHFFDFRGPSVAVDTSCASSLAALHLAVCSLRNGECDAALVAAVNLVTHPYHLALLADLDLLAAAPPDGAFDAAAAGWSPGEGVAAVLLRPRAAAIRDGDAVRAVVEATHIGHLGGEARFGLPNASELSASVRATLAEARVAADQVGYVECAAAGAALADAAEVEALSEVFAERHSPIPVGTVKPNIGHLEAAAGLSQMAKVMLQLHHRQLAPTIVSTRPSPLLAVGAVRIVDSLAHWNPAPDGGPLRALISAVGAAGSYGHAILREPGPADLSHPEPRPGPQVVVLSAESPGQLRTLAARLQGWLLGQRRLRRMPALADLAYTLQTGRAQLRCRLAARCTDMDELLAALAAYLDDETHQALTADIDTPGGQVIQRWLSGEQVDWPAFWPPGSARRVALPTYPFAQDPVVSADTEKRTPASAVPAPPGSAEEYLIAVYAELSGISAERLDPRVPLEDYGLTSRLIARLNERLTNDLGPVPATLFFEHPNLADVAAALPGFQPSAAYQRSAGQASGAQQSAEPPSRRDAVAIIGIAGRYPQASDLDELWRNLSEGRDVITALPADRARPGWPLDLMVGGFIHGVDEFDPLFFGITPRDAALMDPQERLFMQCAWHTLEDAGYTRDRLRDRHGGRAGVFVGSMYNEYQFFGLTSGQPTGSAIGGIANRVSYFLDIHGPSITVDTMCSSSLTAIHFAVTSLRAGDCELALAGGVNLSLHPNKFRQLKAMHMVSTEHRCRSFGAGGDGFVPGEGVGAVLLKPLSAAVADGDPIHAVILGTAINHDGKTNGYTVPNPVAQGDLVLAAIQAAGVPPASISYLEAHGTGTALGDPVEINGLSRAFAAAGTAPTSCAIGSVKSSIGHLEAAAGIAGLTKVVLQLRHRMFAPSIHADPPNTNIRWEDVPFRVQREAAPWDGEPRRAGVSAFGAGGANAHIIVESHVDTPATPPDHAGQHLVVLSARTIDQLRLMAERLAKALGSGSIELADAAYTLQVGREAMCERVAVVGDAAEVRSALQRFAAGDDSGVSRGRASPERGRSDPAPTADLAKLADHWVRGGQVDWAALHPARRRIVGLPGYPFARMHCWPADASPEPPPPTVSLPLFAPQWRPVPGQEVATADRGISGPVICLFTAGQRKLAEAVAAALGPATVLLADRPDAAADMIGRYGPVAGWLDLCALDEDDRNERDDGPWGRRLAALQKLLLSRPPGGLRVLQVTSGVLDLPGARPTLKGARLAGFVRSLGAEHPWASATVLDIDRTDDEAGLIAAEWHRAEPLPEVCLRGDIRHRRQLVPVSAHQAPAGSAQWQPDPERVYVVTGGTRGLGALVARHFVALGARRLAVLGRRPLPPRSEWTRSDLTAPTAEAVMNVRELERHGARVMIHTGPLSDQKALAGFLAEVRRSLGQLAGVVHCAGCPTVGRPPLVHKDLTDIQRVLEPKGDGVDILLSLTASDPLDMFLLFSSVSSALPVLAAGVADYAAANAYLDYVAGYQRRIGRTEVRAVNWPVWRESGRGAEGQNPCAQLGLGSLSDTDGLAVLDRILALPDVTTVLPTPPPEGGDRFDAETALTIKQIMPGRPPAVHRESARPLPPRDPVHATEDSWLVSLFAETLQISEREVDTTALFGDLGVESVLLGELVGKIEERLGRPVEPSTLLDHPTLDRLGRHLRDLTASVTAATTGTAGTTVAMSAPGSDRVAVIGMACRFPGGPDLDAFWRLLREGRSAVTEVPMSRWDTAALYQPQPSAGRSISKWGGFLDGIEDFDPQYFGMTDAQARDLDPAIRLMLEGTATCLAHAGYDDRELRARDIGVFVGARMSEYRRRIDAAEGAVSLGGDQNFIAAVLAHRYDLRGPNLVLDSACSSALVAVQLACASLLSGESELAISGGVDVLLDEEPYLQFSAAKALSPRGRCAAFARDADGFVPGEGCGVLLLKRLDAAIRDGDQIHAVIDAVAVGNDGHTMGLTTPNPAAQARVVRRALDRARLNADDIEMVEAHGTATMIGDPIELRALTDAYREQTKRVGYCALGSVKSNIGHLLSAAGMAGLIKTVLSLGHGQIPPTLHCEEPNPRFDFAASPFFPNTRLRAWPAGRRAAGVSAFGLGGTNAHLIATSYRGVVVPRRTPLPPPAFRRRRLWRDRDGAGPGRPVANLLDLDFRSAG